MTTKAQLLRTTNLLIHKARRQLAGFRQIKAQTSVGIETISGKSIKLVLRAKPEAKADGGSESPAENSARREKSVRLSACQLRVLMLIINGLPNRAIAERLRCSIKTVEKHRQHVYAKFGAHEAASLARHALSLGLVRTMRRQGWQQIVDRAKLLTAREIEVLKLVALGAGNKWIAAEWGRSIKTVDHHREHIMKKLGVHDVPGLTQCAVALGLLDAETQ